MNKIFFTLLLISIINASFLNPAQKVEEISNLKEFVREENEKEELVKASDSMYPSSFISKGSNSNKNSYQPTGTAVITDEDKNIKIKIG